jgi:hypothetical protein
MSWTSCNIGWLPLPLMKERWHYQNERPSNESWRFFRMSCAI